MRKTYLLLMAAALLLPIGAARAQAIFDDGFETPFQAPLGRGGSNYLWFGQDPGCGNGARDDYALLPRYHDTTANGAVRAIAQQQLATMYARGMRRMSLGVFFMHQPAANGTLVDSGDPQAVARIADNLALLLADVKAAGFSEVLFRFFPVNNINPSQPEFPGYSADAASEYAQRVDEYWNMIVQLRPVLLASGLPYRIDLMVEGAARDSDLPLVSDPWKYPSSEKWSRTARTLWQRYRAAFGIADTVGFSFLIDETADRVRARARHMRYVYEGVYPFVFAVDVYGTPLVDARTKFTLLHQAMVQENPPDGFWNSTGWIIAEAHYEDPLAAREIGQAIAETGRPVFYLTQWPLDRAGACLENPGQQVHVNVLPPYRWSVWGGRGY